GAPGRTVARRLACPRAPRPGPGGCRRRGRGRGRLPAGRGAGRRPRAPRLVPPARGGTGLARGLAGRKVLPGPSERGGRGGGSARRAPARGRRRGRLPPHLCRAAEERGAEPGKLPPEQANDVAWILALGPGGAADYGPLLQALGQISARAAPGPLRQVSLNR